MIARLIEANGGRRVDVVLDAVRGRVFDAALGPLAPVWAAGHIRRRRRPTRYG
jgi:hypothetical protein